MDYNVLEEAKHALNNFKQNAWDNHKEQYLVASNLIDDFQERIDYQELKVNEAKSQEEFNNAQAELTKIIDEIIEANDSFKASMIPVNDEKELIDPEDTIKIDTDTINKFLDNMEE